MSKDHDDKFDSEEPELEFSLEEIFAEFSDRARKEPDSRMPIPWRVPPDRAEAGSHPGPACPETEGWPGTPISRAAVRPPRPGRKRETASASPAEDRPAQVEGEDTPPPVPEPVPEPGPEDSVPNQGGAGKAPCPGEGALFPRGGAGGAGPCGRAAPPEEKGGHLCRAHV